MSKKEELIKNKQRKLERMRLKKRLQRDLLLATGIHKPSEEIKQARLKYIEAHPEETPPYIWESFSRG